MACTCDLRSTPRGQRGPGARQAAPHQAWPWTPPQEGWGEAPNRSLRSTQVILTTEQTGETGKSKCSSPGAVDGPHVSWRRPWIRMRNYTQGHTFWSNRFPQFLKGRLGYESRSPWNLNHSCPVPSIDVSSSNFLGLQLRNMYSLSR